MLGGSALAHHGWGSYDAARPITVAGPILTSKYENPHVTLTVRGSDKVWTVTLAPTSRMVNRGALVQLVVGRQEHFRLWLSVDGGEGRDACRADHCGRQDHRDALMEHEAPALFVALEQSAFAAAIRQSIWIYPLANVGHIVGLFCFAGALAVMDLRPDRRLSRHRTRRR